jgi:predicted nucleic acid-binding protein
MSGSFIDSNVLLYLTSSDESKAETAGRILETGNLFISTQVINECAYVLRRKFRRTFRETEDFILSVLPLVSVRPVTLDVSLQGLRLAERYQLSVWDAIIVASSLEAGADVLWTEDLHDGLIVDDRLRVANPFAARG